MSEPLFHKLADSSELEEGKGRPYTIEDHRIAAVRHAGTIYAVEDRCPHADASIAFGPVENGCIACPWHYAEFRLSTGEVLSGPAVEGIRTYLVREREGIVEICLEQKADGSPAESTG